MKIPIFGEFFVIIVLMWCSTQNEAICYATRHLLTRPAAEWVLGYTVLLPITLVHTGKYTTEDKIKIHTLQKLNTTQKQQTTPNTAKQNYPGSVASYNTQPGNKVGLFYNDTKPTQGTVNTAECLPEHRGRVSGSYCDWAAGPKHTNIQRETSRQKQPALQCRTTEMEDESEQDETDSFPPVLSPSHHKQLSHLTCNKELTEYKQAMSSTLGSMISH